MGGTGGSPGPRGAAVTADRAAATQRPSASPGTGPRRDTAPLPAHAARTPWRLSRAVVGAFYAGMSSLVKGSTSKVFRLVISGLAQAVVIVDAAEKGGALITATHATEHGRGVLAIPGAVDSPAGGGANKLQPTSAMDRFG